MKKTPVLVLCDDLWHPAEVVQRGLQALPQHPYSFEIVKTAKDILTPAWIERFPMILCCKSNCVSLGNSAPWFEEGVTEVMPADLERYIRAGHGFLALHSGLAYGPDDNQAYCAMVGGRFLRHPPRCEVSVQVSGTGHPVASGVEAFRIRDEHYEMDITAPDADVFLTSTSEQGGVQPAGYTRIMGQGRLCALTPGHTRAVWEHPQFQHLLLNAIAWCLKEGESHEQGTGDRR